MLPRRKGPWALWLALLACGEPGSLSAEGGEGALEIQVLGLDDSIRSAWVEILSAAPGGGGRRLPLVFDGERWRSGSERLPTGAWQVQAFAFEGVVSEGALEDRKADARFASRMHALQIEDGRHQRLSLFLLEQGAEGQVRLPRFLSVRLDRGEVERGGELGLEVEAEGGSSPLQRLYGRFYEGQAPGRGAGEAGLFGPSAPFDDGERASIRWLAPEQSGPHAFLLAIRNEGGDEAELGVEVEVQGGKEGDVDFAITFNHAPEARLLSEVVNDGQGTEIRLSALLSDPEGGPIAYAWSHDCGSHFLWSGGQPSGSAASGDELQLTLGDRAQPPGGPRSQDPWEGCEIQLRLTDDGRATRLQRILIPTGWIDAGVGGP